MWIVPSITVSHGRTIGLIQGNKASEKIYDASPLELTEKFIEHGITRLHLVDIDGAHNGKPANLDTLEMLSAYTNLNINFTGGLHTDGEIMKAFECGASSITAATIGVYNKNLFSDWIMSYGRNKIVLAADTLDGNIRVGGWQKETKIDLFDHVSFFYERGLKFLKTTDISKDGISAEPSFDLYKNLKVKFPELQIFASGGISTISEIEKLADIGVQGVILGKSLLEGKISLKEIEQFISRQSVEN